MPVRNGKVRTVVMTDELWDAMVALAERNGRNGSAEVRQACAHWLAYAGGVKLSKDALNDNYQATRRYKRSTEEDE